MKSVSRVILETEVTALEILMKYVHFRVKEGVKMNDSSGCDLALVHDKDRQ
jgi:hypothetical protein